MNGLSSLSTQMVSQAIKSSGIRTFPNASSDVLGNTPGSTAGASDVIYISSSVNNTNSVSTYEGLNPSLISPVALTKGSTLDTGVVTGGNAASLADTNSVTGDTQEQSFITENATSGSEKEKSAQKAEQKIENQEQAIISELAARDREVRAHEQAHAAVGGAYAGAPSYQYEQGPDGVNYAVAGEVPIDVSPGATPKETLQKAQVIQRAALAPAEPSPQDRAVAAQAAQMELQAQIELAQERQTQSSESSFQGNVKVENQDTSNENKIEDSSASEQTLSEIDRSKAGFQQLYKEVGIIPGDPNAGQKSSLSIFV